MMSVFDLVIRNGEVITAQGSQGIGDLGIKNGKIAQIGKNLAGEREIDASGKLVLPGGIDAHVHLSMPPEYADRSPRWVDDFESGSAAALAGGITTVGNMTSPGQQETPLQAVQREMTLAAQQTMADIFFHPVLSKTGPEILNEIDQYLDYGINSIKIFTVFPHFDPQLDFYLKAIRKAGEKGLITVIHCEDSTLIQDATERLVAENKSSLRYYPESRPVISEVVATQKAVALAEVTGSPMYVVHLSCKRALEVCVDARSRGLPVYVETRPLYLFFTSERFNDPDGAKFVGQPPLREQADIEALWIGIQQGYIQTVCTDHAPWMLADKLAPEHTITNLRPGVADLQFLMPVLYSEGVRSDRISLGRFVQVTSTNAARLFGLFPQKGTIAIGSDADLVVFDPNLSRVVEQDMYESKSDYSVFESWQITGWPTVTIRRGEIAFQEQKILAKPGSGQVVSRTRTMEPQVQI
jgi:dihydropyrimidinase